VGRALLHNIGITIDVLSFNYVYYALWSAYGPKDSKQPHVQDRGKGSRKIKEGSDSKAGYGVARKVAGKIWVASGVGAPKSLNPAMGIEENRVV